MTYPLSLGLQAHLLDDVTTLAACWRVILRDDREVLGTSLDVPITINSGEWAGTYQARAGIGGSDIKSSSDMSVDNLEVKGALGILGALVIDLSAADIEAGEFDNADVSTFLVNWKAPNDGIRLLKAGWVGNITHTKEGAYTSEVRGLSQIRNQTYGRTLQIDCDAHDLGDDRCKFSPVATYSGTVATVVSARRRFTVTWGVTPPAGDLIDGKVTWNTGDNTGYQKEIREDATDIRLFDKMPYDIQVGDTFTAREGCDRKYATCKDRFGNLDNFRGHMVFAPGDVAIIKVGKR